MYKTPFRKFSHIQLVVLSDYKTALHKTHTYVRTYIHTNNNNKLSASYTEFEVCEFQGCHDSM